MKSLREKPGSHVERSTSNVRRLEFRAQPEPALTLTNPVANTPRSPVLKALFWVYFILLVFEGALRKWMLPQFSAPLLVIRDPIVLLIYACAWQQGFKTDNRYFNYLVALIVASSLLVFLQMVVLNVPQAVLLYGLRSNFLHMPLIFIIPMAFSPEDLHRLGRWVLLLCLPLSVLMTWQFEAAPDAWINRAAGLADGQQLPSALGRIRPAATFSFITGVVSYFSLATAFLLQGLRSDPRRQPIWLLVVSSACIILASAVSGSRACVLSALIVLAMWVLGLAAARQSQAQLSRLLLMLALGFACLSQMEVFQEGTRVLSARWQSATESEEPEGGLPARIMRSLLSPSRALIDTPIYGRGLGVGTNVGSRLLTGEQQFLLSEEEWARLVLEMGPVLGLAFILWRLGFLIWLARASIRCATQGATLPLLFLGSCSTHLLTGQLHQSTTQGFTSLLTGLCFASIYNAGATSEHQSTPKRRRSFRRVMAPGGKQRSGVGGQESGVRSQHTAPEATSASYRAAGSGVAAEQTERRPGAGD